MIQRIRNEVKEVSYFIEKSPQNEDYVLALENSEKKQYILSKYIPRKQALKVLGNDWGNRATIWILFGFNFGYMLDEIFDKVGKDTKVIIIEPNSNLLNEQIKLLGSIQLLKKENVLFITEKELECVEKKFKQFIPETEFGNLNIRFAEEYLKYYINFYNFIVKLIYSFKIQCEVSFNTLLLNEEMYMKNTIQNRVDMVQGYDLSNHRNKYKNIPALIVGAGPSLVNNIEEIRNFKGIIMVMGRTMTPLMERGIRPDFVFSLDPCNVIYDTFNKYKEHDIPLITLVNANAKVVKGSKGPKYFLHNSMISNGMLGLTVNPCLDLMGSVTTLCLSTAKYMGCSPIVFVGQDLAFTNNEGHSKITLSTEENIEENKIELPPNIEIIKEYHGGKVQSDSSWVAILRWIEYFIQHNDTEIYGDNDTIYINATEGGAYIEGMKHISLKQAIAEYCRRKKPKIMHRQLEANKDINVAQKLKEAYKGLRVISRAVEFGAYYYKELLDEYESNKRENLQKVIELTNKIKRVDAIIGNVHNSQVLVQIIMKRVKEILTTNNDSKEPIDETEVERRIRFLSLNYQTYENLVSESKMLLQIIEGEMEE